jgi:hypothetical protein
VLAAISIKSTLDKKEFFDALDNLASIPTSKSFVPISMQHKYILDELLYKIPYKVIFAFKGLKVESLAEHLEEYIRDRRPEELTMPDLIIVNKSYYIVKASLDGLRTTKAGEILPKGSHRVVSYSKHIGAIALMRLVSEIQMVSNFSSLAMIHFNIYELTIQEFLKQRNEGPFSRDIDRRKLIVDTDEVGTPKPNEKNNNDKIQT